jgi:hypothetical protein
MAAGAGALPLAPRHLAVLYPDLFPSEAGAKEHLRDAGARAWLQGCLGLIKGIYKTQTPLAGMALYRAKGQAGSEVRALIDPFLSPEQAQAALEARIGAPLAMFQVASAAGQAVTPPAPGIALAPKPHPFPKEAPMSALALSARPPLERPRETPILRPVDLGAVMPLYKHPLGAMSEICIRPPVDFAHLAVWRNGPYRPSGWNFGLPLPAEYRPPVEAGVMGHKLTTRQRIAALLVDGRGENYVLA